MKKIIALIAALLLVSLLAIPASADFLNCDNGLSMGGDTLDTGTYSMDIRTEAWDECFIAEGANVTIKNFLMANSALTVKKGAHLTVGTLYVYGPMTVESGATLTVNKLLFLSAVGRLTVKNGGKLVLNNCEFNCQNALDLYGDMSGNMKSCTGDGNGAINAHNGASISVTATEASYLQAFTNLLKRQDGMEISASDEKVALHTHNIVNGVCTAEGCGFSCPNHGTNTETVCADCGSPVNTPGVEGGGATLSEGSRMIVVGILCCAIGFVAAMLLFRRKKA